LIFLLLFASRQKVNNAMASKRKKEQAKQGTTNRLLCCSIFAI